MGNNCVGFETSKDCFFPTFLSTSFWWSTQIIPLPPNTIDSETVEQNPPLIVKIEQKPIQSNPSDDSEESKQVNVLLKAQTSPKPKYKPMMLPNIKRVSVKSAGLRAESVLLTKMGHFREFYKLGDIIGEGQYGTTSLCFEKATGKKYACKSIQKVKLMREDDIEDVKREVQIMHHLVGCPNVISIKGAYEDPVSVHIVMELCEGGELFDKIAQKGCFSERKAAELARTIVSVVETFHSLGIMHRDLKLENFLFVDKDEDSTLKAIDFGLSVFFKPGESFSQVVGSSFYIAPEVLGQCYGPEADVWSAGVIIYILLCRRFPFDGELDHEIFDEVLNRDIDFSSDPWPRISESAKDLVRKMLLRDPRKRITAHEALCHPWIQVN